MKTRHKKLLCTGIVFAFAFAVFMALGKPVSAADPIVFAPYGTDDYNNGIYKENLNLEFRYFDNNDTFADNSTLADLWLPGSLNGDNDIKEYFVDKPEITDVRIVGTGIRLDPQREGSCVINVLGKDESLAVINVKVDRSYIEGKLKAETWLENDWYGTKKVKVLTEAGSIVNIRIGSYKTKNYTVPASESVTISLPKVYKLNTKFTVNVTNSSRTVEPLTFTKNGAFSSVTDFLEAKATKKKMKLTFHNLHKNDVVKFVYKGKTYSKKITKDKDDKDCTVTFKTKKKLTKNASFKVKVINKDKKTLLKSKSYKLTNWTYDSYDYDHDGESGE